MKHLFTTLLLLATLALHAQTQSTQVACGNTWFELLVHHQYPELENAFRQTFDQAKQAAGGVSERMPYTVNVVVHVVYKFPEENLADSVILDQIAVLNEDYNRLNADAGNLRPVFEPFAGMPDIHFNLVAIERVQTNAEFAIDLFDASLLPGLKNTNQGGSDAWDTEHFLNIWICNIRPFSIGGITLAQILGFAFPPNGLNNWPAGASAPSPDQDGVVVDYRMVGRNNPNPIENPNGTGDLLVRGRTATHEVGHYLGLRHIWGDGGLLGPNDCNQSDGIDDTPFASSQSEFDCDFSRNTCVKIEAPYNGDAPDMVENFMDYSAEDCQNSFTAGQAALMRAVLEGPRSGLLQPFVRTEEPNRNLAFRLFPNPATDVVTLRFESGFSGQAVITLFDASGRTVRTWQSDDASLRLDGVPEGVYAVQVRTEDGVWVEKLVVR